ncbi:MAG: hypothetical protein K0S45_3628 [Nitrospira sp.]|jgi:hypothetical protein|nr:hypothetical protein [Nitrospira sp.]
MRRTHPCILSRIKLVRTSRMTFPPIPALRSTSHSSAHNGDPPSHVQGRAAAPLGSQSICRHEVSAMTRHTQHHCQHEPHRQLLVQCLCQKLLLALKRELMYHRHHKSREAATQAIFRVHGGALQSEAPSLDSGRRLPGRAGSKDGCCLPGTHRMEAHHVGHIH